MFRPRTLCPIPVSTATGRAGRPITIGNTLDAMAVAPDGKTLYVTSVAAGMTGFVTPVSTVTRTPGMPVIVGLEPYSLAITPDGAALYVAALMGSGARHSTITRVLAGGDAGG